MDVAAVLIDRSVAQGQARVRLRGETRYLHALLDGLPLSQALASGEVDAEGYLLALQATEQVFAALELPAREGLRDVAAGFVERWSARTDGLRADIGVLGGALWQPDMGATRCDSVAESLGWLYVLEGSLLGGQVIRLKLEQSGRWAQLQTRGMLRFHSLPRQQAAARWSTVVSLLDAELQDEVQVAAATRAACRAFNEFIEAFRRAEVERNRQQG
jgi:heme oxygenase